MRDTIMHIAMPGNILRLRHDNSKVPVSFLPPPYLEEGEGENRTSGLLLARDNGKLVGMDNDRCIE